MLTGIEPPGPVTPEHAATAFIRATDRDIEPVSAPITELAGALAFIDTPDEANRWIVFNARTWTEHDIPALLRDKAAHEHDPACDFPGCDGSGA